MRFLNLPTACVDSRRAAFNSRRPWVLIALLTASLIPTSSRASDEITFSRDILPILSDNCFLCHGPDAKTRKADLRLDVQDDALRTKDPVIIPGKSSESELLIRVTSTDAEELMPPRKSGKTLSPAQIDVLRKWIDGGAKWGKHWSFEPPLRPVPPAITDTSWPRTPIDRFILARLEKEGLKPSPIAEKTTLIRRLSLDLTGLPPTINDVDAFVADNAPDAYERLVDRLLASPHYGERMVWEWLDAARYADSNGYQGDSERTMWPWRDWAVDALNRNLPFDEFTVWQLAGDLLPNASHEQKLATGFARNHAINGEGGRIPEENRVDYVMDMVETTGTVWLGLAMNCCRCHDHKFDQLTQRDYYSLFAYFNQTPVDGGNGSPQTPPVLECPTPNQSAKRQTLNDALVSATRQLDEIEARLFPRPAGEPASDSPKASVLKPEIVELLKLAPGARNRGQIEQMANQWLNAEPSYAALLKAQREAIDARDALNRSVPRVMVMEDMPKSRDSFLLARGSYEKPGEKVTADVPKSLSALPSDAPRNRLALARWLVSPENPLTARVTVNRLWQQFFGIGLVKTSEDFGVQGERPSHPELLDWLATELVRTGWDVKALHRLIVTSAAYQQSSRVTPVLFERDPQNRLLARGPRFRLPAWMIRDQALAASGLMVQSVGGPPVNPYQPTGVWEEATFGTKRYRQDSGDALYRRSLYTFWRRIVGPTEFFDSAARQTCVVRPTRTNTPLHALTTLNDVTYVEAARALAERVLKSAGSSPDERIALAFRLILARLPSASELEVLRASLERTRAQFARDPEAVRKYLSQGESQRDPKLDPAEHAAYAALGLAIFNLDEALAKE
jgi:hypothetical protein